MAKVKRKMIQIEEDKCTGCGACITDCPEGALKIVDTPKGPKARLVKENFCDGLGACMGACPVDALHVIEREADAYDENGVINHIKKNSPDKLDQHIEHLKKHGMPVPEEAIAHAQHAVPMSGCPGSRTISWGARLQVKAVEKKADTIPQTSELRQWPVQLMLVNPAAEYFQDADLVVAADCVPFAYPAFHQDFLKGKALVIACPKLDDTEFYKEKLTELFKVSTVKSVTVVNMVVPCCFGLQSLVQEAIKAAGKKIPYCDVTITLQGEVK